MIVFLISVLVKLAFSPEDTGLSIDEVVFMVDGEAAPGLLEGSLGVIGLAGEPVPAQLLLPGAQPVEVPLLFPATAGTDALGPDTLTGTLTRPQ
jgi:hypothetical protein